MRLDESGSRLVERRRAEVAIDVFVRVRDHATTRNHMRIMKKATNQRRTFITITT